MLYCVATSAVLRYPVYGAASVLICLMMQGIQEGKPCTVPKCACVVNCHHTHTLVPLGHHHGQYI